MDKCLDVQHQFKHSQLHYFAFHTEIKLLIARQMEIVNNLCSYSGDPFQAIFINVYVVFFSSSIKVTASHFKCATTTFFYDISDSLFQSSMVLAAIICLHK